MLGGWWPRITSTASYPLLLCLPEPLVLFGYLSEIFLFHCVQKQVTCVYVKVAVVHLREACMWPAMFSLTGRTEHKNGSGALVQGQKWFLVPWCKTKESSRAPEKVPEVWKAFGSAHVQCQRWFGKYILAACSPLGPVINRYHCFIAHSKVQLSAWLPEQAGVSLLAQITTGWSGFCHINHHTTVHHCVIPGTAQAWRAPVRYSGCTVAESET